MGTVYESETSVEAMERRFTQFWSLKEAFVKATGMGLGYDLGKIEFDICDDTNTATVWIEGKGPSREWSFHLHELAHGHWVSVARDPQGSCGCQGWVQSYISTTHSQLGGATTEYPWLS
eukprot:jgi/Picre1/30037/NNA_005409.t1